MTIRKKVLIFIGLLFSIVLILACGEATNANTATNVSGSTVTAPASTPVTHFKVGDQVKIGSTWVITVNSVKTATQGDNEFDVPKDGNIFLIVDVSQKNISGKQQFANATFDWKLRDSTGQEADEGISSAGPDGDVENGGQVRGKFVWEVPKTEKAFTLEFDPEDGSNLVIWDLSV